MIKPDLLRILCCPETRQPVRLADPARVERLNALIAGGTLKNRAGKVVSEKLDGALIREDEKVAYAIRGEIPVMLIEEGIAVG